MSAILREESSRESERILAAVRRPGRPPTNGRRSPHAWLGLAGEQRMASLIKHWIAVANKVPFGSRSQRSFFGHASFGHASMGAPCPAPSLQSLPRKERRWGSDRMSQLSSSRCTASPAAETTAGTRTRGIRFAAYVVALSRDRTMAVATRHTGKQASWIWSVVCGSEVVSTAPRQRSRNNSHATILMRQFSCGGFQQLPLIGSRKDPFHGHQR